MYMLFPSLLPRAGKTRRRSKAFAVGPHAKTRNKKARTIGPKGHGESSHGTIKKLKLPPMWTAEETGRSVGVRLVLRSPTAVFESENRDVVKPDQ
jgi:hypothetical protein